VKLTDITVEVRDKTLARLGAVNLDEAELTLTITHNNVGSWELSLPAEDELAQALAEPGAGIIITGPSDVLLSGPTAEDELAVNQSDYAGMVTFTGVSDSIILSDMLAWPQPSNSNPATQNVVADVRTGAAETLMHAYVNANIGPGASAARKNPLLTMGANLARGSSTTKSARFPKLGALLAEIGLVAGLGFRVVQRGAVLAFETYAIADKTTTVRLDAVNGTLTSQKVVTSAPGITRAIVGGDGEGVKQQIVAVSNTTAQAAELEWARPIEQFIDAKSSDTVAELTQAGNEALADDGFTAVSVQAVPADDMAMEFGVDWYVGDLVSIVRPTSEIQGMELTSPVTGCIIKVDDNGLRVGAILGDPKKLSDPFGSRLAKAESRISALERSTPRQPRVQIAVKANETQTILNSTTYVDDDTLKFDVVAGYTYLVRAIVYPQINASSINGRFRWTFPTPNTFVWSGIGSFKNTWAAVNPTAGAPGEFQGYVSTTSPTLALEFDQKTFSPNDPNVITPAVLEGTFFCVTSGTVHLQWSPSAATTPATFYLKKGSSLRADPA
jgi:hypothetical protein